MNSNIFDRLSFLTLAVVVVLLPLFCLPFTNIPVEISKGLLLVLGLAIGIIFWAMARFFDGKIVLPKSWILVSGLGIVIVFLFSALLSSNSQASMFGTMFDPRSFWFIFAGFILMFLSSVIFRTSKQAKMVLLGIILSSAVLLIFQTLHLFVPDTLSLGILSGKTANLLGSWNVLGLFSGFACLMFLLVVEFFPVSKIVKIILQIFILLSVLLVATVNFYLTWILLGISALIIFVYKASLSFQQTSEEDKKKNFPTVSFVIVIVALLFFLNPQIPIPKVGPMYLGSTISNLLKISNTEIGPSFSATLSTTKGVLLKDPILGMGPNRFGEAWAMYKPIEINTAAINGIEFWDVYFESGSGLLSTLTATTGGLGILAWIVFLVLFLVMGSKSIFSSIKKGVNSEMIAFFVLSLYLYISLFFYSAGPVIFLLALSFTGIFIGLATAGKDEHILISFLNDHRKSFFSIMGLILLIILAVATSFKYIERFASISYFGKAVSATTVPDAEANIGKAISLYSNDLYLRTYSQIYIAKLGSLANKGSALSEQEKTELQASFDQAVRSSQLAVAQNPSNYINFLLLGAVYNTAGALGVKDAYPKAVEAYQIASNLNPLNPGIKLSMAKVSLSDGKTKIAKDYANSALELKPDYIDALLILSQIAKSEGDTSEALSLAEKALVLSKNNKDIAEYVNSLKGPSSTPKPDSNANKPKQ
ncbi:MAG: hypothetical protein WCT44_02840 [Candidatus Paceibacterota bacterium]